LLMFDRFATLLQQGTAKGEAVVVTGAFGGIHVGLGPNHCQSDR